MPITTNPYTRNWWDDVTEPVVNPINEEYEAAVRRHQETQRRFEESRQVQVYQYQPLTLTTEMVSDLKSYSEFQKAPKKKSGFARFINRIEE